jgi:16S rRNA (guanine966-N2)-methyltransferase
VRVVAGSLRGRRLKPVPGTATRPTADRVKEALFDMLGPLDGARVLDLYAGTGSLGIEAISRGATLAVFVENARPALAVLRDNVRALALDDRSHVIAASVDRAPKSVAPFGPFDVVLADPPYADLAEAMKVVEHVARDHASPDVVVVVEHASRDEARSSDLEQIDRRTYGDSTLTFFKKR